MMNPTFKKIASLGLASLIGLAAALVQAKLPPAPPLTEEQKAKAEEAKAKKAEADKKEMDLLAKYQDKAAENFKARTAKASPLGAASPSSDLKPAANTERPNKP